MGKHFPRQLFYSTASTLSFQAFLYHGASGGVGPAQTQIHLSCCSGDVCRFSSVALITLIITTYLSLFAKPTILNALILLNSMALELPTSLLLSLLILNLTKRSARWLCQSLNAILSSLLHQDKDHSFLI